MKTILKIFNVSCYVITVTVAVLAIDQFDRIKSLLERRVYHYWNGGIGIEAKTRSSFEYLDELVGKQNLESFIDTVDYLRDYVFQNSIHLIDEEHALYSWNTNLVFKKMVDFDKNISDKKPHLSCGPRALVLEMLLDHYNIENRVVQLYSDDYNHIRGHIFNEIFDKKDNSWHIQDPDFNIYYSDSTGRRLNLYELVFVADLERVLPTGSSGVAGWDSDAGGGGSDI